ncbi:MAG: acyl-CoA carboxylase subunit epsilon [Nocardioides sp.]
MGGTEDSASSASSVPFLRVVNGDATPEEVAALTAVLQGLAAAAAASGEGKRKPRSEWSAHHRKARPTFPSGPGGWRSSAMPR